jgi:hypothetical protein
LVDATADGKLPLSQDIAAWLLTLPEDRRRAEVTKLMELVSVVESSPPRAAAMQVILQLDDADVAAIVEANADFAAILHRLAKIPARERSAIIEAGFPIAPADLIRARLWQIINSPDFPAADLLPDLAELAKANPDRLAAVRRYFANGAPLTSCQPVACTPMPCVSHWQDGYSCPSGFYPTVGPPKCISLPSGRVDAQ